MRRQLGKALGPGRTEAVARFRIAVVEGQMSTPHGDIAVVRAENAKLNRVWMQHVEGSRC